MQHLIFHEIPDIDTVVEPENRQQRLQIMLANLEKQRITVRNRILAAAQETLSTLPRYHPPSETPKPASSPDIAYLLASLAYTRSTPNADEQGAPPPPPPPPSDCIPQVEPPAEVTLAVETLRQLKEHDERCKKGREPYERALERLVGHSGVRNGGANGDAGRRANGNAAAAATDPRRRPSGYGGGRV